VLTDSDFDSLVLDSNDLWFVKFYAPWCGHCKNLKPEWAKAATALKGSVKIAKVDATAESDVAGRYGVRGYPTIKIFPPHSKDDPEEY
jgi:protein disulfide-isomerase A6